MVKEQILVLDMSKNWGRADRCQTLFFLQMITLLLLDSDVYIMFLDRENKYIQDGNRRYKFMLDGKKILLCVTGGIAVYKAAALTSKLTQAGADVKVILSESATKFVTPLTFQALSRNDVYTDTFDEKDSKKIAHIDLADWADLILVAPATANIIGKIANGIADNMISTTLLAATSPVWIAPAMNVHMYEHPAVKEIWNSYHNSDIILLNLVKVIWPVDMLEKED